MKILIGINKSKQIQKPKVIKFQGKQQVTQDMKQKDSVLLGSATNKYIYSHSDVNRDDASKTWR